MQKGPTRHYREGIATLYEGGALRVKAYRVLGELEYRHEGKDITYKVTHFSFAEYIDETGKGYDEIRTPIS